MKDFKAANPELWKGAPRGFAALSFATGGSYIYSASATEFNCALQAVVEVTASRLYPKITHSIEELMS